MKVKGLIFFIMFDYLVETSEKEEAIYLTIRDDTS